MYHSTLGLRVKKKKRRGGGHLDAPAHKLLPTDLPLDPLLPLRLFQALDLRRRSPESGDVWYKSKRLKKTVSKRVKKTVEEGSYLRLIDLCITRL